ncbi:MAG TPA: hypothetical protein VHK69_07105 [Chitinophagaceae bacterium]|jgi:hypothetical protein|nr:hypothetical protein [Chitinophagaceae bacterium]
MMQEYMESPGRKNGSEQPGVEGDRKLTGKRDDTDAAREEAFGDIEQDADLSIHSPNDDLDEGETARLGEDRTDLV